MASPFHAGEREVQARAGVREMAERVGRGIHPELWPAAEAFLAQQRLVVLGAADGAGAVWATALAGPPGFVLPIDEHTVHVAAAPGPDDPLAGLRDGDPVGLLAIDVGTRRRVRVNGRVERPAPGWLVVHVRQAYGNCPKYIQMRDVEALPSAGATVPGVHRYGELTEAQRAWIAAADTFFIATLHPEGGADASHRGGSPGFVRVEDGRRLAFPDYAGNTMFNTLGNLAADGRAGLLFVDWETGATLQLTGRAEIDWSPQAAAQLTGAERVVRFEVAAVVETQGALPLRGRLVEPSPFNPG